MLNKERGRMKQFVAISMIAIFLISAFSGCLNDSNENPLIYEATDIDFKYIIETQRSKSRVIFIENSSETSQEIISWNWEFGDGNFSNAEIAFHTYDVFGTYNVSLVAGCKNGKIIRISHMLNISEPQNKDANSTTMFDHIKPTTDHLSNKWAILGADDYQNIPGQTTRQEYWFSNTLWAQYEMMIKIGIPEEHIIVLMNEQFTKKNLGRALDFIENSSSNPANSTVVLYYISHGVSVGPTVLNIAQINAIPTNSRTKIRKENASNMNPEMEPFLDYDLKAILEEHNYGKMIVFVFACESGCFAGQDATGKLHQNSNLLYSDNCGGPNRIVIASSVAPLGSVGASDGKDVAYTRFWKEGIIEGKADADPVFGNGDGKSSIEEAFYYYAQGMVQVTANDPVGTVLSIENRPCMNDQYPTENPEDQMFI